MMRGFIGTLVMLLVFNLASAKAPSAQKPPASVMHWADGGEYS